MKQKKLVYLFLVIAISLTLFLPLLNLSFTYANKKITLESFSKQQLFSTDNLESIINYIVYKVFRTTMNESHVIVGKDDYFFLGESHSGVIAKTNGTFIYAQKDIDRWVNNVKKLQTWYENHGIEFILIIASNKHTIYNDKLPEGMSYKENGTITDAIVKAAQNKKIHILDLKKPLREKKQEKQLYFLTDTHWNNYGALIGYLNTMVYLNSTYTKKYNLTKYSIKENTQKGGGDLSNFLKINHFLSDNRETNFDLLFNNKSELCYGKITTSNTLEKCTPGIKNTFNQYSINKNAANKEKILYLCDSFGTANTALYSETFHTVWKFHLSYMHRGILPAFIKEHKPDIVIYQVVERDLGNNTILDDIPQGL